MLCTLQVILQTEKTRTQKLINLSQKTVKQEKYVLIIFSVPINSSINENDYCLTEESSF